MDDPPVRAIGGLCETGEEDTAAEKVEPPHAVAARVPLSPGLEILCGSCHHRWRKCFALFPRRDLAEPEGEGADDVRYSHRVRGRTTLYHYPRRGTTDLDLHTKIGDEKGDIRNRPLERRLLKCRGLETGGIWTHNKFSCWTRDVEVDVWCRVVPKDWMQNWGGMHPP